MQQSQRRRIQSVLKKSFLLVVVYFVMFLIVFYSKELSEGIKNGINVALNLVIPSMFLFMILSNIIIQSNLSNIVSRPFHFLSKWVFHIPKENITIVVLSLVGGYPVGAKLLGDAVRRGEMSPQLAERMLCYCVNCGPAFLISGVGTAIFGSQKLGLYLYLSQIVACLVTGFLCSFGIKRNPQESVPVPAYSASGSVLIVGAVNDAVRSLGIICGFVVAFSSFMPITELLLHYLNPEYATVLQGLLEVTNGCNNLVDYTASNRILLAAVFTAFGGICVHLQVCAMLKSTGIRMGRFFLYRIPYILVSAGVIQLFLTLFPDTVSTLSYNRSIHQEIYSVSPAAAIFLLLLAVMLLFFTRKPDRIKHSNE